MRGIATIDNKPEKERGSIRDSSTTRGRGGGGERRRRNARQRRQHEVRTRGGKQDSSMTRGRGSGRWETVALREVVQRLTTNQRKRGLQ